MSKQEKILLLGIFIIVLMGIFPPWLHVHPQAVPVFVGYSYIFYPVPFSWDPYRVEPVGPDNRGIYHIPDIRYRGLKIKDWNVQIDLPLLLSQWLVVTLLVFFSIGFAIRKKTRLTKVVLILGILPVFLLIGIWWSWNQIYIHNSLATISIILALEIVLFTSGIFLMLKVFQSYSLRITILAFAILLTVSVFEFYKATRLDFKAGPILEKIEYFNTSSLSQLLQASKDSNKLSEQEIQSIVQKADESLKLCKVLEKQFNILLAERNIRATVGGIIGGAGILQLLLVIVARRIILKKTIKMNEAI